MKNSPNNAEMQKALAEAMQRVKCKEEQFQNNTAQAVVQRQRVSNHRKKN